MNIPSIGAVAPAGFAAPRPNPPEHPVAAPDTQVAAPANVTQQAVQEAKKTQPSQSELEDAVKKVNEFVGTVNNSLNFSIDKETGETVVKVIDNATKEVIKQFPSEEMLAIARALDNLKGLLVQQKA